MRSVSTASATARNSAAWAADDRLFPLADAERLAALLPDARVEVIAGSRAFSMIDQPGRLAELVTAFAQPGRARLRSAANSGQGRVLAT